MKKGFTLIEMTVSVSIIILLTAALGPALLSGQKQADIETVSQAIRAGVIDTQSLAFAPEPSPSSAYPTDYIFHLNFTNGAVTPASYNGTVTIPAYSYAIIGKQAPSTYWRARVTTIDALPTYALVGTPAAYGGATFFKIHFRVPDGTAGCSGIYYEKTANWSTCSTLPPAGTHVENAEIKITVAGKDKYLSINIITGATELKNQP